MDDEIAEHGSMAYLSRFKTQTPYTHTFVVHMGEYDLLDKKYDEAFRTPVVCETERFTIHDMGDRWAFVSVMDPTTIARNGKSVLLCTRDYGEMTVYMVGEEYYEELLGRWRLPSVPFTKLIRAACEAGMALREGLPLHASLIEKDGYGIVFLGPSGMGKSTQAKLWVEYQGSDFIIGDRPCLRLVDGKWCGFGMPWDGKDGIIRQKSVPVKALVSLEQASENHIVRLDKQQAIVVLLNQAMMPMWDDAAMECATKLMERVAMELPFYHLKNLADRETTEVTLRTIKRGEK